MRDLDLTAEMIDIRDVIERYEELEAHGCSQDEFDELAEIRRVLDDLQDRGGDEQWRGDWYPITLVSHDYFVSYVQDLVVDCGYLPADLPSWIAIDWEKTADAVKDDYSLVTVGTNDYWYR